MRDPVAGDMVDQYQLSEILARSGMASIFKAKDTESGQTVVLKIPHFQYESDIVFSERFRREDEVGQTLSHPNIVKILKPREKSGMYLAMEFVEGRSLRAILRQKEPVKTETALGIAAQVLEALAYLHEHGVVHRDIKPENILITPDGQVKILDFGIALFEGERRLTWSGLSHTVGTPDYMAPEQIRGRRGDPRTDVYAVGTLLFEMLTCHFPFESPSPRALFRAKTSSEPRPPSYYVKDFDVKLETLILRAIARDPRQRYASANQLLADIRNPSQIVPRDAEMEAAHQSASQRARRRALVTVVLLAIVVGLVGLIWLSAREPAPSPNLPVPRMRR